MGKLSAAGVTFQGLLPVSVIKISERIIKDVANAASVL